MPTPPSSVAGVDCIHTTLDLASVGFGKTRMRQTGRLTGPGGCCGDVLPPEHTVDDDGEE